MVLRTLCRVFQMFSKCPSALNTYPINNNGSSERGTDDARDGADSVGYAHQNGGVLGSHVKMVHTKPGPGETAQSQGQ